MIVKKEQIMRIILEQQSQEIKFRFYSATTIGGLSKTELATYESIIPKGSTSATYEHCPDIQFDALALVKSEWQDIAYLVLLQSSENESISSQSSLILFIQPINL